MLDEVAKQSGRALEGAAQYGGFAYVLVVVLLLLAIGWGLTFWFVIRPEKAHRRELEMTTAKASVMNAATLAALGTAVVENNVVSKETNGHAKSIRESFGQLFEVMRLLTTASKKMSKAAPQIDVTEELAAAEGMLRLAEREAA